GLRGSGPASTDSSRAASATVRAIGPCTPSVAHGTWLGWLGTRPGAGRSPTTLQNDAGLRSEPPMSLPSAIGCRPVASAAAAPPLLPPAVRVGSYGLRVAPKIGLNVWEPAANSGTLVLPIVIAPAARMRSTTRSSTSGTWSRITGEPNVVRMPAVRWVSLCATGRPFSGPIGSPAASRSSAAAASASARSGTSVTIAFTCGLTRSMRSRWACTSSRAETSRRRSAAAISRAVRRQTSVMVESVQHPTRSRHGHLRAPNGTEVAVGGRPPYDVCLRRHGDLAPVDLARALGVRPDVHVEDGRRQEHRAAGVRDVHDAADAALDRGGAEDQVALLTGVAPGLEVLDRVEARVAVGERRVHVGVGVVAVVHGDPDEGQELRVARLDVARHEDGVVVDRVLLHAALDQVDVEVDEAAHLDGAAEVDLAVALAEVQVATGEQGVLHVHRVEDAAAAAEVLDVVVAAVLPGRHGAGALPGDRLRRRAGGGAGQHAVGERRQR